MSVEQKQIGSDILHGLSGVSEQNQVFLTIQIILREQGKLEMAGACLPNLTSEARHYNCGRAAAISDLQTQIKRLLQRANTPAI